MLRGAQGFQPHPGAVVAFLGLEDQHADAATDVDILAFQSSVSTRGVQETRDVVRPFPPLLSCPIRVPTKREMRHVFESINMSPPAMLTPLAAWLWWRHYDGNAGVGRRSRCWCRSLHAYIVPGVGTNVLRVWEFDTRLRLGPLPAASWLRVRQCDRHAGAPVIGGSPEPHPAIGSTCLIRGWPPRCVARRRQLGL